MKLLIVNIDEIITELNSVVDNMKEKNDFFKTQEYYFLS